MAVLPVIGALVLLGIAALDASAQSAKTLLKDPELATRFNDISDRLVCQCGCQMIVRVCNHQNCPSAIPIRRQIEKRLMDGHTDDDIVNEFVEEHGLKVLSSPPAEGLNLAVWVMPGIAVIFGFIIVGYFVSSWSTRKRLAVAVAAAESASPAKSVADDSVRHRIEKELTEME